MHYISIHAIRSLIGFDKDLSEPIVQTEAINYLERLVLDGTVQIGDKKILLTDLKTFILSLNSKNLIFLGWIEQHILLKEFLLGGFPNKDFEDIYKWEKHALINDFKQFLAPFLQPILLENRKESSIDIQRVIFSFILLLPLDDRMFVEQELFKPIKELILSAKDSIAEVKSEKELILHLQPICNDSMTAIINYLSRASYASKVWYVDQLLWIIQQKGCTVRLANWILKQLEAIELNPEHIEKVTSLKKDLRQGKIKVKNFNYSKREKIPFKSILTFTSLFVLLLLIVWIIWKKPYSQSEEDLFSTATSYEQFSKEERKKLDSLLRDIQKSHSIEDNQIDPNMPIFGNGISLNLREPLKNKRMEQLYTDLLLDADLHDQGLMDYCAEFSKTEANKQLYKGVVSASFRNGSIQTFFKNESEYLVYIVVFENFAKGKIFSQLVLKGATIELNLKSDDNLLFIAGNSLGKFIPPAGASNLPTKDFDHHFCQVDQNYNSSLENIYFLANPQNGKNKLLFSGDKNGYFSVVDLYGILEMK